MRILFIKPNSKTDTVIPPIGLGYLSSILKDEHETKIVDCRLKISLRKLLEIVKDFSPDIVGIQVYNFDKQIVYKYLYEIKKANDKIITVIGGPCPSCEEEQVLNYYKGLIDYAFIGESELSFKRFIKKMSIGDKDFSDVEGLIYRYNGKIVKNSLPFIDNLDILPYPDWDSIPPDKYPCSPQGGFARGFPVSPIIISRGCPYKCNFCAGHKITGYKIRYRSVENVLEEIKLLVKKFNVKEIHIIDDNFTFKKDYILEFCDKFLSSGIKLNVACPNGVRIDSLDKEVLTYMKKAGFYILHLGIESGSKKILKYMNKNMNLDTIKQKAYLAKSLGYEICGYFIIGYPGETKQDLSKTKNLILSLPLDRVMIMNFLPIPGTEIYEQLKQKNFAFDAVDKNFYTVNYINKNRTIQKFNQIKLFIWYYLRPKILIKNLLSICNISHLYFIIRRIYRLVVSI